MVKIEQNYIIFNIILNCLRLTYQLKISQHLVHFSSTNDSEIFKNIFLEMLSYFLSSNFFDNKYYIMKPREFDFRRSEFSPMRLPTFMLKQKILMESHSITSLDDDTKDTHSIPLTCIDSLKGTSPGFKRKTTLSEAQNSFSTMNIDGSQRFRNTLSPNHGLLQRIKTYNIPSTQSLSHKIISSPRELLSMEQTLDNLDARIKNARSEMFKKNKPTDSLPEKSNSNIERLSIKINSVQKKNFRSSFLSDPRMTLLHCNSTKNNPYTGQHTYYVSQLVRAKNQKNSIAMQHLSQSIKIIKNLEEVIAPSHHEVQQKKLNLKKHPMYQGKKTIIFDLDQTLIHCTQNIESECDVVLTIKPKNQVPSEARINIRPYTLTLLQQLYKDFELIIFTASQPCYADVVLDYIDPDKKLFQHRLYRQHCYDSENGFVKDIRIINRPLSQTVIVDNSAFSYCLQLQNAIPIFPYYQGSHDFQFRALQKYFLKLKDCKDVRQINKRTFKLHEYSKFQNTDQLIKKVYSQQQ